MGISPLHARFIVLEHARRRLPETVHLMGRQTVMLTLDEAVALIKKCGVEPHYTLVEIDRKTRGAQAAASDFISDRTFFGLLGVRDVLAIDCSDYEGADLILDLNNAVPEALAGTLDFIFGGSVLDNIFDPATYLKNITRLLKPGGRLFEHDLITQHHHPYCLVTPAWFHDYFVMNKFAACALFVTEGAAGFTHVYALRPNADDFVSDLGPPRSGIAMGVTVIAEKGPQSTFEITPIQDQYRSDAGRIEYRNNLAAMVDGSHGFTLEKPTSAELCRLDVRISRSFRYLGVIRSAPAGEDAVPTVRSNSGLASGLHVLEATYGGNCIAHPPDRSAVSAIYRGNVTHIIASMANGTDRWQWRVDVATLGDPAPERGKDLEVYYVHSSDALQRLQRAYIPAEASGRDLLLQCNDT